MDEASELTRSGEMESQDTSTETEKNEAVNINETDFGISQPQPEKLEDSNLEIFEDTETMEAVPDISETSDHQEAEVVQEAQTETPQESFQESTQEVQTETPKESFQESYQEAQTEAPISGICVLTVICAICDIRSRSGFGTNTPQIAGARP